MSTKPEVEKNEHLSEEFCLLIAFEDLCHEPYVAPAQTFRALPLTAGSNYP